MMAGEVFAVLVTACICTCRAADVRMSQGQNRFKRATSASSADCSEVQSPVPKDFVEKYRLDTTFYKKIISVYGIPILGSDVVDDRALQRACYTVRFMLAGSQKLREGMVVGKARVTIIASSEKIFKVPEFARYSRIRSWASRRGSGGTLYRPVTVAGQENLLCEDGDPYGRNEDILVHELAHAIHLIAGYIELPFFNERLLKAHQDARSAGLWQKTYSARNHKEYLAMGVQAYLNQQREGPPGGNGVYNSINTREELMLYDKTLYDLIEEILPCPNRYIPKCSDLDQSLSPSQVLEMDCDTDMPDYSDYGCEDTIGGCDRLMAGCQSQAFVINNCKKSCGKC